MPDASRARSRGGQSIVEFLLISPVFFLMLFLLVELIRIGYSYTMLNHAAFLMARKFANPAVLADAASQQEIMEKSVIFKNKEDVSFTYELLRDDKDLLLDVVYKMPLLFPFASEILSTDGFFRVKSTCIVPLELN